MYVVLEMMRIWMIVDRGRYRLRSVRAEDDGVDLKCLQVDKALVQLGLGRSRLQ